MHLKLGLFKVELYTLLKMYFQYLLYYKLFSVTWKVSHPSRKKDLKGLGFNAFILSNRWVLLETFKLMESLGQSVHPTTDKKLRFLEINIIFISTS